MVQADVAETIEELGFRIHQEFRDDRFMYHSSSAQIWPGSLGLRGAGTEGLTVKGQ